MFYFNWNDFLVKISSSIKSFIAFYIDNQTLNDDNINFQNLFISINDVQSQ